MTPQFDHDYQPEDRFLQHLYQRLGRTTLLDQQPQRREIGAVGLRTDVSHSYRKMADTFMNNWTALKGEGGIIRPSNVATTLLHLAEKHAVKAVTCWGTQETDKYKLQTVFASAGTDFGEWKPGAEEQVLRTYATKSQLGITACDFAVAETGSIVLLSAPEQGRLVSLLPPIYVALIPMSKLVPRMSVVLEYLAELDRVPPTVNVITGPSRTGDIEMVLTVGVHGPGIVYAYMIDDEESVQV